MAGTFELDLQEELGGGCSRFREQRCRKEQSVLEEQSCGAWGALGRRVWWPVALVRGAVSSLSPPIFTFSPQFALCF